MSVSVALCTHNGGRFIGAQLRSILQQSSPVDELVISDDDSADDTLEAARAVVGAGVPLTVRWLKHRPALGVTRNFECAVGAAQGDLIALSDQDDVWHPDKIERAVRLFADEPGALLMFTDARLVDEAASPLELSLFESLGLSERELGLIESGDGLAPFLRRNLATGATVVFRRELLELALPFPATWVHDEWLAVIAALHGGVRVLREQTVDYRQHGGNAIGVTEPTLGYKVKRMLQPRGRRNDELAQKFSELAARASSLGLAPELVGAVESKAAFERARANMPSSRAARIPAIARLSARGLYSRFASQGRLDILRDLLAPHGS